MDPVDRQSATIDPSPRSDREWTRLDDLAGVVLQTALAVQIAAVGFALSFHGTMQVGLFVAAGISLVGAISALLSLGIEPTNEETSDTNWLWRLYRHGPKALRKTDLPHTSYDFKRGYVLWGLGFLLVAIEGGTLFSFVAHHLWPAGK
jgi:hypothetical protein